MELDLFVNYIQVVTLGICLCVGYVIKASFDFIPNKYIPAIMLILGTIINCGMNIESINATIVLSGMISGLASTGLYEAFTHLIHNKISKNNNNNE